MAYGQPMLTVLSRGIESLRNAFNRDADKTRLMFLVSPTCEMCRKGAMVMQSAVLDVTPDSSLHAYVAWVPILPGDSDRAAEESRTLVQDGRATHFWDEQRVLPQSFARVLGLPQDCPAWDVYLAYPPGVRWENEPPLPAFWHHQLGDTIDAPKLDGAAFAAQLQALLTADR
jgi:hypothetical protein